MAYWGPVLEGCGAFIEDLHGIVVEGVVPGEVLLHAHQHVRRQLGMRVRSYGLGLHRGLCGCGREGSDYYGPRGAAQRKI